MAIKRIDAITTVLDKRMSTWERNQENLLKEIKQLSTSMHPVEQNAGPDENSYMLKATAKALTLRNKKTFPEFVAPIPKNHNLVPIHVPSLPSGPSPVTPTLLETKEDTTALPKERNEEKREDPCNLSEGQDYSLPFPSRLRKRETERHVEICKKLIGGISVNIPLLELIESSPYYTKITKDLISRKKDFKVNQVEVSHEC